MDRPRFGDSRGSGLAATNLAARFEASSNHRRRLNPDEHRDGDIDAGADSPPSLSRTNRDAEADTSPTTPGVSPFISVMRTVETCLHYYFARRAPGQRSRSRGRT
jgi:hypothetical protein